MSVAAALLARDRRLVRRFRAAGASAEEGAQTPAELGTEDRLAFERLRKRAVRREVWAGRFSLDEAAWSALCRGRRRMAELVVLAGCLVFWIGSGR